MSIHQAQGQKRQRWPWSSNNSLVTNTRMANSSPVPFFSLSFPSFSLLFYERFTSSFYYFSSFSSPFFAYSFSIMIIYNVFVAFAGVAGSYDVYAKSGTSPINGYCAVALGLGGTVVNGGYLARFSPGDKY